MSSTVVGRASLRAKYLDTPELEARALKVAEEIWIFV
jgi:hypothetical protein